MVVASAAAFTATNVDVSKALFHASATIDESKLLPNQILIAALGIPINPSDVLQVKGLYRTPIVTQKLGNVGSGNENPDVSVGGNEGAFRVTAVGSDVKDYKPGDWVILKLTSFGTWRSHAIVSVTPENPDPLIVVSNEKDSLSLDDASTISTNPSTAYQLLNHYISDWNKGDWLVANAGNSFVNKYLFQLAKHYGIKSLAVARKKSDSQWRLLVDELSLLGATEVVSVDDFVASDFPTTTLPKIVGETGRVRLALDSLGGSTTPNLAASLSNEGIFVNYGGLSGGLVSIAPGVLLAKNITVKSYWLTRNTRTNPQSKVDTIKSLLKLYKEGVFQPVQFTKAHYKHGEDLGKLFIQAIEESSDGKRVVVFDDNI